MMFLANTLILSAGAYFLWKESNKKAALFVGAATGLTVISFFGGL